MNLSNVSVYDNIYAMKHAKTKKHIKLWMETVKDQKRPKLFSFTFVCPKKLNMTIGLNYRNIKNKTL
jgi:hypothetical protein